MRRICLGFLLAALLMALPAWAGDLPDVPGKTNPLVAQSNIRRTICVVGWSKTQRPPASYTDKIKKRAMAAAHVPWAKAADYELDHLISIELGGHPRDPANLWLQSYVTKPWNAHLKDRLENHLHRQVCSGAMTLAAAQNAISGNWIESYKKAFGSVD